MAHCKQEFDLCPHSLPLPFPAYNELHTQATYSMSCVFNIPWIGDRPSYTRCKHHTRVCVVVCTMNCSIEANSAFHIQLKLKDEDSGDELRFPVEMWLEADSVVDLPAIWPDVPPLPRLSFFFV